VGESSVYFLAAMEKSHVLTRRSKKSCWRTKHTSRIQKSPRFCLFRKGAHPMVVGDCRVA
jgi:hypothetical protein